FLSGAVVVGSLAGEVAVLGVLSSCGAAGAGAAAGGAGLFSPTSLMAADGS
ncbi:hypothetical protein NDU88_000731, partial [Pleurodeles waltl]